MDVETPAPVPHLEGTIAAFERAYPDLYWHIAKGKLSAGEPLYGAAIFSNDNVEIAADESDISAEEAFRLAVEDAGLTLPEGAPLVDHSRAAALIALINNRIGQSFDDEATFSSEEALQLMSELETVAVPRLVAVGTQHRISMKEPTASWCEWRDGKPNLSAKSLEYLNVQERTIYAAQASEGGQNG